MTMRARLGTLAIGGVVALCGLGSVAQAAAPKLKVVGFAAIYKNSAHLVHAKNGGSLSRCDDQRSFSVVVDVSNIVRGTPYQLIWLRNGAPFFAGKKGTAGYFDAKPSRIEASFRRKSSIPDGRYTFRFMLDGKVRAIGTVTRSCAG
jgi:hypothetical protein